MKNTYCPLLLTGVSNTKYGFMLFWRGLLKNKRIKSLNGRTREEASAECWRAGMAHTVNTKLPPPLIFDGSKACTDGLQEEIIIKIKKLYAVLINELNE